jgi:hypothetical protein
MIKMKNTVKISQKQIDNDIENMEREIESANEMNEYYESE